MNQKSIQKEKLLKILLKYWSKCPPILTQFFIISEKRTNLVSTYYVAGIYQKKRGKLWFEWD